GVEHLRCRQRHRAEQQVLQARLVVRQRVGVLAPLRGPAEVHDREGVIAPGGKPAGCGPRASFVSIRVHIMAKKTIPDLGELKGKKVLVRVDFNVPLDKKTGEVKNDRRIRGALPTVQKLLDAGAAVIAMSHLGRPEKATPEERKNLTMDKVATRFGQLLGRPVKKAADEVVASLVDATVKAMKPGDVVLLENLRFDPREQRNDPE